MLRVVRGLVCVLIVLAAAAGARAGTPVQFRTTLGDIVVNCYGLTL